uniref:PUM-HD domain-containing protein n=1 Tax=Parastrongyloides trichosuri TaxID=131310 RepID=A0A0N5A5G3_PARTI
MALKVKKGHLKKLISKTNANINKSIKDDDNELGEEINVVSNGEKTPNNKKRKFNETSESQTPNSIKKIKFLEEKNEVKFYKKGSVLPPLKPSQSTPGRSILKTSATSTPASVHKKVSPKTKFVSSKKNDTSSEDSDSDTEIVTPVAVKEGKKKKIVSNGAQNLNGDETPKKKKENNVVVGKEDVDENLMETNITTPSTFKKKKNKKVVKNEEENKVENDLVIIEGVGINEVKNEKEVMSKSINVEEEDNVTIEEVNVDDKKKNDIQMFTKEDKEKMKTLSTEEKTKFINARLYETCKGKKKSEVRALLRELRVKKKPHVNIAYDIKQLWEELRMKKTPLDRKKKLALEIISKVKGEMFKLVNGSDTSRVFQHLLYLNDDQITKSILDELSPHLLSMSRSKYASFFVTLLFQKTDAAERDALFQAFRGHIAKLYDVVFSAKVIDILYNQIANDKQKFDILCEFFGKEFIIFRQTDAFNNIDELFEKQPEKKSVVLKSIYSTIKSCVGKKSAAFDFTHVLIQNFLKYCSEDQKKEIIDMYREKILDLSSKKEGSKIALQILFNSNAKERKSIIKLTNTLVPSICMDIRGRLLIMGILDTVDDTVLVKKTIIHEIVTHLPDMIKSCNGNIVVQYIVQPRDPAIIGEEHVKLLAEGDGNEHSKKDKSLRAKELYEELKDSLLEYILKFARDIFKNKFSSNLLYTIFENNKDSYLFERNISDDTRKIIYEKIVEVIEECFKPDDDNTKNYKFLEHNHQANFVITELLKTDSKMDVKISSFLSKMDQSCFTMLLKTIPGMYLVLNMFKYGNNDVKNFVKKVAPKEIIEGSSLRSAKHFLATVYP